MAKVAITKSKMDNLANAVAAKSGASVLLTVDQMTDAVLSIQTDPVTQDGEVRGKTSITPSDSATLTAYQDHIRLTATVDNTPNVVIPGYISIPTETTATVNLDCPMNVELDPIPYNPQTTPQEIPAGTYFYGGATITAMPSGSATPAVSMSGTGATVSTGTNTITLSKSVLNTPRITAGYISTGTSGSTSVSLTASVTVNPTPTVSGATVTIPAGYYSSQTMKSVASGSASAPSTISGTSATISTGTNTLTLTKAVSVTPTVSAGYVSAGTATNSSVSLTASVTTKAAATITPTTTNQTIASGTYLTGTQTIAGDADLVGGNILSTANIFGVQGTVVVQNYYTGSSAPSSSLGSDGDIYVQQ